MLITAVDSRYINFKAYNIMSSYASLKNTATVVNSAQNSTGTSRAATMFLPLCMIVVALVAVTLLAFQVESWTAVKDERFPLELRVVNEVGSSRQLLVVVGSSRQLWVDVTEHLTLYSCLLLCNFTLTSYILVKQSLLLFINLEYKYAHACICLYMPMHVFIYLPPLCIFIYIIYASIIIGNRS